MATQKNSESIEVNLVDNKKKDDIKISDNILKDLSQIVISVIEKKEEKPKVEETKISITTKTDDNPKVNEIKMVTTTNLIENPKIEDKPVLASVPSQPTKKKKKPNEIDYLVEDDIIPNQMYCCISFLSPEGIKNCSLRGVKVRGCFPTQQAANEHAEEVRKKEPYFHVFVGETGKWLPHDPSPDSIKDQNYMEKELNDLMKEYLKNQEHAKRHHEFRKEQMLQKHFNDERTKKMHDKLEKKVEEKKKTISTTTINSAEPTQNFSSIQECDEKLKQLNDEEKKIKEEKDKLQKLIKANKPSNEKVDKIYQKLQSGFVKKEKK